MQSIQEVICLRVVILQVIAIRNILQVQQWKFQTEWEPIIPIWDGVLLQVQPVCSISCVSEAESITTGKALQS